MSLAALTFVACSCLFPQLPAQPTYVAPPEVKQWLVDQWCAARHWAERTKYDELSVMLRYVGLTPGDIECQPRIGS